MPQGEVAAAGFSETPTGVSLLHPFLRAPDAKSGNVSAWRLPIEGPLLLCTRRFADARGSVCETYSERDFQALGVTERFVQDNHSLSRAAGTLRGMHFQAPPAAQAKLVRVLRGAILDVIVDLRRGSASFGRHVACNMSGEGAEQLYVPAGFAHGFVTLEAETEVAYKVDDFYAPELDRGLAWDDPELGLPWPELPGGPILSDKDRLHPRLRDLPPFF
ncbi:dTDP-4-dehydrorhamnose 3,5-epimerase [Pararoseomonas indoligenes]|uniref:dTDP-4-dehydrorhamnose 3,5-epimerase n=1 Tax=Roseomonas indoligenes TaxID=2820811 RepID=A0A940MZ10_9PROT|nr:dTDP-4-dehydrorhamnose 3,5-epimerase [Pararoseomonas indoligenes]MBP0494243.1 dTDP-4-dehydrorhamnose 3,5-epimerase [Pararoseomonas indoligenes]